MKWFFNEDNTEPLITASRHIDSKHSTMQKMSIFPPTALLFYMHGGVEYLRDKYCCKLFVEKLPRFLQGCPVYSLNDRICFLDGGRGAPQAADTIETLAALGVKQIVSVGMCGGFSSEVDIGDIIVPKRVLIEEGTSYHYYAEPEYAYPDELLALRLAEISEASVAQIISTDALYRQTYFKEDIWRGKGCVGVDMETSAIFSVSNYLGLSAAALLIVSDKHPIEASKGIWKWHLSKEMRCETFELARKVVCAVATENGILQRKSRNNG